MTWSWSQKQQTPSPHRELVRNGALLLDVRTPEEFAESHVPGAKNIPVQVLHEHLEDVGSRDRKVVVYCRSGARSARAAGMLRSAGFEVLDIGGIHNW